MRPGPLILGYGISTGSPKVTACPIRPASQVGGPLMSVWIAQACFLPTESL
ncbi:MAG: hypothetical protein VYC70_08115 [Verrucomicrobiota bacterium]|nr:hypothetical protein [Verrucomicrobiota bacterium]